MDGTNKNRVVRVVRVPRPALEYLLEHFDVGTSREALLAVTVLTYALQQQDEAAWKW